MHDKHFEALADERRRAVLLALLDADSHRITLDEDGASDALGREQHASAMYHRHLPKLEAAGLVTWNPKTDEVERGDEYDQIRPLLETIDEQTEVR